MPFGELNNEIRINGVRGNLRTGGELAACFGWNSEALSSRTIARGGSSIEIARAEVAGQPAALFALNRGRSAQSATDMAALYAYHAAVDWGVVADDAGLTIFNSHWLLEKAWFSLPRIQWGDAVNDSELLRSLSPAGVVDGEINRLAIKQKRPTEFLKPVDDELVERLDKWRDEALRFARDAGGVDSRLQTLYAQLFVLRTVEDRGLDHSLAPLSSIPLSFDRIDWNAWKELILQAQRRIGSDLFDTDVTDGISEHVFAGVIRDLYEPRSLPVGGARYDFSWIEADVLGLAYEKYLATVLLPAPAAAQKELFLSPEREVERLSVRKRSGVYYTPKFIRDFLSAEAIDEFFEGRDPKIPPRVIDFSCGSGSFLVGAVDAVLKHLKKQDPDRHWARELVDGGFIAGVDIDQNAVNAARLHLWQRLVQEPNALPLPNLSDVIIVADGLERQQWGKLNRQYDIVLGNPPFLASGKVASREELELRFITAKGRFDFSYLFVEQAIHVLEEDGVLGMVVPNRLFKNNNGQTVRELLATQTSLLTVVDFGSTKPFNADAYIGCFIAKKRIEGPPPANVRVLEVHALTPDFLAAQLLAAANGEEDYSSQMLKAFWARHPTSGRPWSFLSEKDRRSLVMLEELSVPLNAIAEIWQGIRTGANDLFIFEIESSDGASLCRAINGLGESSLMETELLQPVVFGSEVQRYDVIAGVRRILYPYRDGLGLSEGELETRYPNVYAYLHRNRDLLAARSSMQQSGGKWFELVRPRDANWLKRPKLLIRDLAPQTSFALDQNGSTFLVGGTAIIPNDPDGLLPLLAYLNSKTVDELLKRKTPQFRGSFQKFEPQHLSNIPVLRQLVEDSDFAQVIASLASDVVFARQRGAEADAIRTENQIDAIIVDAALSSGIAFN